MVATGFILLKFDIYSSIPPTLRKSLIVGWTLPAKYLGGGNAAFDEFRRAKGGKRKKVRR
jgi:hypothetical protein